MSDEMHASEPATSPSALGSLPTEAPGDATTRPANQSSQPTLAAALGTSSEVSAPAAAAAAVLAPVPAAGGKRRHVHWTHVRTHDASHTQPDSFTREGFYDHLVKCYNDAYPQGLVHYGCVVEERHQDGEVHHHAAICCKDQHYWKKVAKVSAQKYKVPLNASAHDSYGSMYKYLRQPSRTKPLAQIDAEAYLSPDHPRGEDLEHLLAAGQASQAGLQKRRRLPSIFELVQDHGIASALQLQAHAASEAAEGRRELADYCTRHGQKLQDQIDNARAVLGAAERARRCKLSLLEKLQHAAAWLVVAAAARARS